MESFDVLHFLFRVLSRLNAPPSRPHVALRAHVQNSPETPDLSRASVKPLPAPAPIGVTHRQRLFSMRLEHTKLCGQHRCRRLESLNVISAGDLCTADLRRLATHFGAPKKAYKMLVQYRRAIRFAAAVPGMMPRDAMLLISIHRRSVRGLAMESAVSLRRDLERFAESSPGRLQLRGRRLPSTRRLKQWITACEA
jgi:hypothetical protein